MTSIEKYSNSLKKIFSGARDKHEANYKCTQVMTDMSGDSQFLTEVLRNFIQKKGTLNTLHYPVVGINIESNANFELVANCWIPLPDESTSISTKAIHHHGDMLLTTATAFGSGYEHWTFKTPTVVDADKEIYDLEFIERLPHPRNHVAFVDAYIAHLPLYPPDLTITYALWSSRFKTSWKDSLKRIPLMQRNNKRLRDLAESLGLSSQLELKVVEYFDFYPSSEGFRGIKERKEFQRSNNEDFLVSFFHILQETGNEGLSSVLRDRLDTDHSIANKAYISRLIEDLESGKQIDAKLSSNHYGIEYANFTVDQILDALRIQEEGKARVSN